MAHISDIRIGGTTFADRISQMQSNLVERFNKYRTYRSTLTELRSLSDRELNDIDVRRSQIRSIALDAAYN